MCDKIGLSKNFIITRNEVAYIYSSIILSRTELLTADNIFEYDSNNDGIVDANDANFANLKILKGDGTLMTLAEAGITSITLNTATTDITDENANQQFASEYKTKVCRLGLTNFVKNLILYKMSDFYKPMKMMKSETKKAA